MLGQLDQMDLRARCRILTVALFMLATSALVANMAQAETVEEKHDNGQIKTRYETSKGAKHGKYEEFFESGELRLAAAYKKGKLHGDHTLYFENGKVQARTAYRMGKQHGPYVLRDSSGQTKLSMTYSKGKPRGKHAVRIDDKQKWVYVWKNGELLKINNTKTHLRSVADLKKSLQKIYKAKVKSKSAPEEHVAALRQLNAYRYLCGLPADITLDKEQSKYCQAAAKVLNTLGDLSHTPEKPAGVDAATYKDGYEGTTHSNLAIRGNLAESVDLYWYDSDNFNLDRIGHRRWCMNPEMKTTGFGREDNVCVMWSMDHRRESVPEHLYLAFPPQGYMPLEYFSSDHAWCVSLNKKYIKSNEQSRATIYPLDEYLVPGEPLTLTHESFVGESGPGRDWGPENVLIFKPATIDLTPGRRYAVEITGLTDNNGKEIKLHYVVQFIQLGE